MIRNAPRRRAMVVVVIALVGLIIVPVDECDDYAFFRPVAATARAEVPADDPAGSDHQHACSCLVCVLTTDDTFIPRLTAPRRGELAAVVSTELCSSTYLPDVYRPPIA